MKSGQTIPNEFTTSMSYFEKLAVAKLQLLYMGRRFWCGVPVGTLKVINVLRKLNKVTFFVMYFNISTCDNLSNLGINIGSQLVVRKAHEFGLTLKLMCDSYNV